MSGAAEYYTGTRDLNKLGGLGAHMPLTMAAAVIATLSIAGIPPFNGFVSKWLIYQSAFQGGLRMPLFIFLGLVAMFISLVTLASFMKLLGSMFLGKPAAIYSEKATGEVPPGMQIPQAALSVLCVVLGVAPMLPLALLYGAAEDVLRSTPAFASMFGSNPLGITLAGIGAWNPAVIIGALFVCTLAAYGISRAAHATSRETEGWYCGEEAVPDEIRYRAHGFCLPFKQVFAKVYPSVPIPKAGFLKSLVKVFDLDRWLYNPFVRAGGWATDKLSRTHSGVPQLYLMWQIVGVVGVLVLLFIMVK